MNDFLQYISQTGPLQWIGVTGSIVYVTAFTAMQLGRLDGNSMSYTLVNILAASLVAVSLIAEFNLSTALIQFSWIIAGVAGLTMRARKSWSATREVLDTTLDYGAA